MVSTNSSKTLMLSLNIQNINKLFDTLKLGEEQHFSSNNELLDKQNEISNYIIESVRKNIEIDCGYNEILRKCLLEVVNVWEPSLDWFVTSFFPKIDFSKDLNDFEKSFMPTFALRLRTTAAALHNQVVGLDGIIHNYQSSVLIRCCDIELTKDLYINLFSNCCDSIKERFLEFVGDQYDVDIQKLLHDDIPSCNDNNIPEKKNGIVSEDCRTKIEHLLLTQKLFTNRSEFANYKSDLLKQIKRWISSDIKKTDADNNTTVLNILSGWQPHITWDYHISLYGLEQCSDNYGAELLVTHPKYILVPKTSSKELMDYIDKLVRSIIDIKPRHFSVNGEKQFLRDLYTQIYVFLDEKSKEIMERILCSKCNVSFMDYSDEYIEDNYFEFMNVGNPELAGQKRRAFVSEIGGECLGKGLYRKYNIYG